MTLPTARQKTGSISVTSMVESIVVCKWSVQVLQRLAEGTNRPNALRRACPGLSAKVMNERLFKMTRFGLVQRRVFGEKPPVKVEYVLTSFGRRFMNILDEVQWLQEDVEGGTLAEEVPRGKRHSPTDRNPFASTKDVRERS